MHPTHAMAVTLLALLVGCGAPSTPAALSTTAVVECLDGDQYLVSITIRRGHETLATPKVLCIAGEQATIELVDRSETIRVEILPPPPGEGGLVVIDVQHTASDSETLSQHLEVAAEARSKV